MGTFKIVEPHPFVDGIVYGEGPRWHNGRLWFSDGPAGKVYSAGETGDLAVEVEIVRPSGLGDGDTPDTLDLSDIAFSTNDLVVAPNGRAYVDLYRFTDAGTIGDIGLVDTDGTLRIVATELAMPNGLGFLPDGSTLVVNEMRGSRILAFSVESDGSLGTPTIFAELSAERHPDGLCVDAEGAVWIGCYDSGELLRIVAGGTVTHRVPIDRGWAVAPALGGSDGRTLYMVVDDTTHEGLMGGDSTGWILQARVDVPGSGSPDERAQTPEKPRRVGRRHARSREWGGRGQATPRYAARMLSSANNSRAMPVRVTSPVSRM